MVAATGHGDVGGPWLPIGVGVHTGEIFGTASTQKVGTQEFADAVIARLGEEPRRLKPQRYKHDATHMLAYETARLSSTKVLTGVDVFLDWRAGSPDDLAKAGAAIEQVVKKYAS